MAGLVRVHEKPELLTGAAPGDLITVIAFRLIREGARGNPIEGEPIVVIVQEAGAKFLLGFLAGVRSAMGVPYPLVVCKGGGQFSVNALFAVRLTLCLSHVMCLSLVAATLAVG
jgi:hypothetical protein